FQMILLALLFSFIPLLQSSILRVSDISWELIGCRTYEYNTHPVLQCRHWDKVALRWHLYTCERHNASQCNGGSNVDYAMPPENMKGGEWHNAFTYVQFDTKDTEKDLRLALSSIEDGINVPSIVPLKIDVDWKWTLDEGDCNHFSIRMSAMSSLEHIQKEEVASFCRQFDKDHFVSCDHL
ncbi:hypothetical protein PRIPAC_92304, partial [Pristionchus pacificus]